MNCRDVRDVADSFLGEELLTETNHEILRHLGTCPSCRSEIEALHAPLFKTIFKDSVLTATDTRVRLIRPDVAAVAVRWRMTGARDPMGEPWPERAGILSWVVTRHGDQWLIDVSHNMDLPSAELVKAQTALVKK